MGEGGGDDEGAAGGAGDEREARASVAPRTVLLVDDEAPIRDALTRALGRLGYEVLVAVNGAEALRVIERTGDAVDVVVTDMAMPVMTGAELIQRLAESRPSLPVLLVSGYSVELLAARGVRPPPHRFMQKPFAVEELGRAIGELLGEPAA